MLAGHVGTGLALSRLEPRLNVGVVILAALLLDVLLWSFVMLGLEQVIIPLDYSLHHQFAFVFPYSHGLAAGATWSVVVGLVVRGVRAASPSRRAAMVAAAAVFSHWLLDALVHRPELPFTGSQSPHLGLGLWNAMPLALSLELAITLGGLWLYLTRKGPRRSRDRGMVVLTLVVAAGTVVGMTAAPRPPSGPHLAAASLATLVLIVGIALWLGAAPTSVAGASAALREPKR